MLKAEGKELRQAFFARILASKKNLIPKFINKINEIEQILHEDTFVGKAVVGDKKGRNK